MILGFTGPAGVGKSTTAAAVAAHLGGAVRLSFADPMYAMIEALAGFVPMAGRFGPDWRERMRTQSAKGLPLPVLGVSVRELVQTLGTEWGREQVRPELWVDIARARIEAALGAGAQAVLLDDVRFDNEAAIIRSLGGTVVLLGRQGSPVGPPGGRSGHASEQGGVLACCTVEIVWNDLDDTAAAVLAAVS